MALAAATAVAPTGCGGGGPVGGSGHKHAVSEADREQDAGARTGIGSADRTAFVQLASATALVRASAAGTVSGSELRSARARLAALRPRNALLKSVRSRLSAAADALLSNPLRARRASLGAVRTATVGLRHYAERHPGVAGLVPD